MIDWQLVWLAVIAIAVTIMTVVQIAVLLTLARSARQLGETVQQVRQEIRPLVEKVNKIADDAARAAALAVTQVERVDRALLTVTQRVDQTLNVVQGALVAPVREGANVLAAVRSALSAFRRSPERRPNSRDEEEALFVG